MKKTILGLGLALLGSSFAFGQGLENVIVEKFYVSNAADGTGSVGTLPTGSVTYRIYADMLPGYKFQALYGLPSHELKLTTTTTFFNNEDRGATSPNGISVTNTRKNTVYLDSWFSVGATAAGKMGVLKSEDTDGALSNTDGLLQNAPPSIGNPLTTHDGMITGSPETVSFVGLTTELDVFDATSQAGSSFSTTNGSIASLNGSTGPTATNRVLIGQFTTDGVFGFELNIQIGTPSNGVENYVASNPTGAEMTASFLTLAPNNPPTVSITAPLNGANVITGNTVNIAATAADVDGTVSQVEFFVDGSSIGTDNSSPYTMNWTSTVGSHTLTAVATDDDLDVTTSSNVVISVANNQAPTVSVSAAANAIVGDAVAISATASDVDGSVASVEFFVDNVSIGTDNSSPYSMNWTAVVGTHSFKATATDNLGLSATSSTISINVANNIPPTATITSPLATATFTAPQVVTIDATATDADGTVTQVEFFVNNVSIGVDNASPYTMNWTSVIGAASLTVKSTDNKGAITTSVAVNLSIADPFALPYKVVTVDTTCIPSTLCIPVAAVDSVKNVIGYDMVINYNAAKITPTGNVTISNDLVTPSYVDYSINTSTSGVINLSLYFNSSAPANAKFFGKGDIFCIEFTKTVAFTSVDTASVSVASLQESYFTGVSAKLVQAGEIINYRDSLFTGRLRFWADNSAIKYNSANPNDYLVTNINGNDGTCSTPNAVLVQPDMSGQFIYNIWNGLTINIEKNILPGTDVQAMINGADAVLSRKLLVNDNTYTPTIYSIIANDVNMDGVISAGDVSQINQRAVLSIPEFKQAWNYNTSGVKIGGDSKDWVFVDSLTIANDPAYLISATFPADDAVGFSKYRVPVPSFCRPVTVGNFATCAVITPETYKGIAVGDVNGNYNSATVGTGFKMSANEKIIFNLSQAIVNGQYIDVPVSIISDNSINALDFSMKFNEETMSFNSIASHSGDLQTLANFNGEDKTLRFTSNSLQNYDISKPVVSVRFDMNNSGLTNADFTSLAGYLNGEKVNVEVVGALTTGIASVNADNMYSVYPNPANDILNVVVYENATVQLMDMEGKQVVFQSLINANQKQVINTQDIANGVYMMKIYNNNFVSTKKVVIFR